MLGHHQRVLMIAAHPDDEDTELLALLVRGMGAEAAYLSLNRGEGGQNLIGDELGEGLGLLRTEELLAARRLEGGRQFFTRAYDFGFSKTLDDTWAHWPRDSVLKDVVRLVRRFRPQIVVSIFSGTPRDGHGQHQAAGWAAKEAFRIAGDSTRFPELLTEEGLPPWIPFKLYRSTRFDTAATTLRLDGGVLDPAVGQSFHQLAMRGRSLHRSQDMGQLQGIGPSVVRLQLLEDRTGHGSDQLFGGVDTTLDSEWRLGGAAERQTFLRFLRRYRSLVDSARAIGPRAGGVLVSVLLQAGVALDSALAHRPSRFALADDPLGEQAVRLADLIRRASGLVIDAVASDERVVPGQSLTIAVSAWNAGQETLEVRGFPGGGWFVLAGPGDSTVSLPPGEVARWVFTGAVTAQPAQSTPYFLRRPRVGDLYRWPYSDTAEEPPRGIDLSRTPALPPGVGWQGLPFQPPPQAMVQFRRPGTSDWLSAVAEPVWRTNDQARGEIRRPLVIVPRVDVKLDPPSEVWRAGATAAEHFTVTLTHGSTDTTTGTVSLELAPGWPRVASQPFRLTRVNERQTLRFALRLPAARTGQVEVRAIATDSRGVRYDVGVFTVDYPHIRPRSYTRAAVAEVTIAPLALPPLRHLAYVRGAADRVPEALESLGLPVELITGAELASRDLGRYDVIVIGPRAWETDLDLPGANDRLLAYARAGGTVIVQYQQYGYFLGNFAPYPMTVGSRQPGTTASVTTPSVAGRPATAAVALFGGHDRVTDEAAPVRIVDASSPIVRSPNRITSKDWDGWVQERGLYFARTWDPAWKPVLEMHDPGESPLEGGLLVATVGKGRYVYTGLAFFRQLPAGVPGAYRLFANLLALGRGAGR